MSSDRGLGCLDRQLCLTDLSLPAHLSIPAEACGLVLFVHGSGSNRFSRRNQSVAQVLQRAGFATVLFDLLTPGEQQSINGHGLDPLALSTRLLAVIEALQLSSAPLPSGWAELADLPLGLYGSSSGAAVALAAAAQDAVPIGAIVCRGGRPDLVPTCLPSVTTPTLLLVGSHDVDVLELNTWAAARLQGLHDVRVVPGAGHLFAEPGALELVARWSLEWFLRHLSRSAAASPSSRG